MEGSFAVARDVQGNEAFTWPSAWTTSPQGRCLSCRLTVWYTSSHGYLVNPASVNEPDSTSCHPEVIIEWHPENAGTVGSDKDKR